MTNLMERCSAWAADLGNRRPQVVFFDDPVAGQHGGLGRILRGLHDLGSGHPLEGAYQFWP